MLQSNDPRANRREIVQRTVFRPSFPGVKLENLYWPPFLKGVASGLVAALAALCALSFCTHLCLGAEAAVAGADACANDTMVKEERKIAKTSLFTIDGSIES